MGELQRWTLRDLSRAGHLEYSDGYRTKKQELGTAGFPILRVAEVLDGKINPTFSEFVRAEFRPSMRGKLSRSGDVVLTTKGTVGRVAIIPEQTSEFVYSPQVCYFRILNTDFIAPRYLYYWLRSDGFRHQAAALKGQTDMADYLNLADIGALKLTLPSHENQQAIAEVLGVLDDKIAVNERIAEATADLNRAMMQVLWREGRISSLTNDSRVGAPNWSRSTLGELCARGGGSIQTGPFGSQLHASDYVEFGVPSVMPQNIGDNVIIEDGIARVSDSDINRLSKYQLAEGDVIYSRRGDVKRRALVRSHESGWLCGTGCLRVRAGKVVEPLFLSHYLGEPEVQNWIHQHAVGATMPNLNTAILGAVPVVVPPAEIRARINEEFSALDARSMAAVRESQTLTALRDTLLPQLLTGKLRIKDAERSVEEAV